MACSCWDMSRAWVFRLREEGDITVVRAGLGGAWWGREQGENRGSRHVMQQGLETARPPLPEAVSVPRCECVSVGMGAWVRENAAVYLWEYICVRTSECVCESAYVCEYACPSVSSMCVLVCV